MPLALPELLGHARTAAQAAAKTIGTATPTAVRTKTTLTDLVTEFDVRSEETIRGVLAGLTPGIAVVGEEGGGEATDLYWSVDPIDGTVNFAHGVPLWGISIGLVERGTPVAGVVLAPALGQEFFAARGHGAYMISSRGNAASEAPARLRVSPTTQLAASLLASGFPYDLSNPATNNFAKWEALHRQSHACRRLGAASLDTCYVAHGWFDGFWESDLHPWDMAAAGIVLTEAGGRLTANDGSDTWFMSGDVVASNGHIHDELLAALAAVKSG